MARHVSAGHRSSGSHRFLLASSREGKWLFFLLLVLRHVWREVRCLFADTAQTSLTRMAHAPPRQMQQSMMGNRSLEGSVP